MYQLTVDAAHVVTVTDHLSRDAAHAKLIRHVVAGDYYLRTLQVGSTHSTYELLALADDRRDPGSIGHAIIEELPTCCAPAVESPDRCAAAAGEWIAHHGRTWEYGCDTDRAAGYPLAVLTAARAEARFWFQAGTLLPEAARLADAAPIPHPHPARLEALRRIAIAQSAPGGLVERITTEMGSAPSAPTMAALIWRCALLRWGATAP